MYLTKRKVIYGVALLMVAAMGIRFALQRPRADRDWMPEQALMPITTFNGDDVTIRNVRYAKYRSKDDFDLEYEDRNYRLDELVSLEYIVEPFSSFRGAAHTFVSFGFRNGDYVCISVEVRKEVGETYSLWKGLLRHYELIYVVGDERDLIHVRANHRHDDVHLYPSPARPDQLRRLFVDMLTRANELAERPEFYNTVWNNCTTAIWRHVNKVIQEPIPFGWRVVLPGYSDRLAYEAGLIDTDLPFEEVRARFRVNGRAAKFANDPEFSKKIREIE